MNVIPACAACSRSAPATSVTALSPPYPTATAVLTQATTAQQSVSGVNLNEEAANLIQYQQLYQANSKVIQTASTLFSTLLGIFN